MAENSPSSTQKLNVAKKRGRLSQSLPPPSLPSFLVILFVCLFILFFVLVLVRPCGDLSDNAPYRLLHLSVWSQFVFCSGRMRRSDLDEGDVSTWGWALKVHNSYARPSLALSFSVSILCKLSATAPAPYLPARQAPAGHRATPETVRKSAIKCFSS